MQYRAIASDADDFIDLVNRVTVIWDEELTQISPAGLFVVLLNPCSALVAELEELGYTGEYLEPNAAE